MFMEERMAFFTRLQEKIPLCDRSWLLNSGVCGHAVLLLMSARLCVSKFEKRALPTTVVRVAFLTQMWQFDGYFVVEFRRGP